MKKIAPFLLLALGLLQMAGDAFRIPLFKGIGAASAASPAPRVFTAVRGLETYSTRFFLEWTDQKGLRHSLWITPSVYSRLKGPYNRRNIYGAVLSYGPVLSTNPATKKMFDDIAGYALCGDAPILRELGIDPAGVAEVRVRLVTVGSTNPENLPLTLRPSCP